MTTFKSNMGDSLIEVVEEINKLRAKCFEEIYDLLSERIIQEKREKEEVLTDDNKRKIKEDIINSSKEFRQKEILKKRDHLKLKHSVTNIQNNGKLYSVEKKLCKKYLIDKGDKLYVLRTDIKEAYSEKSLLNFIRLMTIYKKALDLNLTTQSMEDVFDEYICNKYQENIDCFEDIHKVIMDFSIQDNQ